MREADRSTLLPLLPVTPALAVLLWWSLDQGGYFPTDWLPGILLALALLVVATVGLGQRMPVPSRAVTATLGALGAYTAWSFASMLWADVPGAAFEGSLRTLLYLVCFALFALLPWTPLAARLAMTATVMTLVLVGAITLARVAALERPLDLFIDARLAAPLGYQNAAAALWTMGAIPALVLASRRETWPALRPLLLAGSGLLLSLALMTGSRGWLFTLPLVALATLALVPGRARLVAFAVPVAGALVLASGPILDVYDIAGGLAPHRAAEVAQEPIDDAVAAVVRATLALLVVGAAMAVCDRWLLPRIEPRRDIRRAISAIVVGALLVVAATATVVVTSGDPIGRASSAWTEFKDQDSPGAEGADVRFTSLGSSRYDFWRVAVELWTDSPLIGAGQDNFAQPYVLSRSGSEEPRWVHSLPLRLLAHTGLVGALLFGAFLAAVAVGVSRAWRVRRSPPTRACISAALLPGVVWLAHGSVDWLWEYPVLSALAVATAGIALSTAASPSLVDPPQLHRAGVRRASTRIMTAGAGTALAAAAILVIPGYVAHRDVAEAAQRWRSDPNAAFDRLERARKLNPFDAEPWLVEGLIAAQLDQLTRAHRAFAGAADREPGNWFAQLQLALVASAGGDRPAAGRRLRRALALNPREPLVIEAIRRLDSDEPLSLRELTRRLDDRVRARRGRE